MKSGTKRTNRSQQPVHIWADRLCADYETRSEGTKHKHSGLLARYLRRDGDNQFFVELTDGNIMRYRAMDFHPYFAHKNPTNIFQDAVTQKYVQEQSHEQEQQEEEEEPPDETEQDAVLNVEECGTVTMAPKWRKRDIHQRIPTGIKSTTKPPATRHHALRYIEKSLCPKSIHRELEKLDGNGRIRWLKPAQLVVLPKEVIPIP